MKQSFRKLLMLGVIVCALCVAAAWHANRSAKGANFRGPHLFVPEGGVDLGTMQAKEKKTTTFQLQNDGSDDIEITKLSANCGCTVPVIDHSRIHPGQSSTVSVTFDSDGFAREINKQIIIESNDPNNPLVVVTLRGYVRIGLRADSEVVNLGHVAFDDAAAGEMHMIRDVGAPVMEGTVEKVDGLVASIGAWEPYFEAERAAVKFSIRITEELGPHVKNAVIRYGNDTFPIRLEYVVVPSVKCMPAKITLGKAGSTEQIAHLTWSNRNPISNIKSSQGESYRSEVRNVTTDGCDLVVTSKLSAANDDTKFEILAVSYQLLGGRRSEKMVIPVMFEK